MTERIAIVTGSARGIGAATARRLAEDGMAVGVVYLLEVVEVEEEQRHLGVFPPRPRQLGVAGLMEGARVDEASERVLRRRALEPVEQACVGDCDRRVGCVDGQCRRVPW